MPTSKADFQPAMAADFAQARSLVQEHPLVLIQGRKDLDDQELLRRAALFSARRGPLSARILHWSFGPVMQMHFDPDAKNYLFSAEAVPFHWDGAFHVEPRFLVFHCTATGGRGGETLFTSTAPILKHFSPGARAQLHAVRLRYKTEKKAHYGGYVSVPLVQEHPVTGAQVLRFAERVTTRLNPVELEIDSPFMDERRLYEDLVGFSYDPRFCYEHAWSEGDVIIADNHALIHGRRALLGNHRRRFKRVQVL